MVGAAAPELPPLPPPSAAKGEWYTSADGSLVTASANRGRRGTIQRRGSGNLEVSKAATAKMAIADAISATAKTKIGADRWQGRARKRLTAAEAIASADAIEASRREGARSPSPGRSGASRAGFAPTYYKLGVAPPSAPPPGGGDGEEGTPIWVWIVVAVVVVLVLCCVCLIICYCCGKSRGGGASRPKGAQKYQNALTATKQSELAANQA